MRWTSGKTFFQKRFRMNFCFEKVGFRNTAKPLGLKRWKMYTKNELQFKNCLTSFMLPFTLRAALQILLQGIRFKAPKDVHGGAISAARLAPRRVAHPLFGRGWGWQHIYHQLVNTSLISKKKYPKSCRLRERFNR